VEDAAKAHTPAAIATLAEICADKKVAPAARVAAAEALLNRAWGRPTQRLAGDDDQPLTVVIRRFGDHGA